MDVVTAVGVALVTAVFFLVAIAYWAVDGSDIPDRDDAPRACHGCGKWVRRGDLTGIIYPSGRVLERLCPECTEHEMSQP